MVFSRLIANDKSSVFIPTGCELELEKLLHVATTRRIAESAWPFRVQSTSSHFTPSQFQLSEVYVATRNYRRQCWESHPFIRSEQTLPAPARRHDIISCRLSIQRRPLESKPLLGVQAINNVLYTPCCCYVKPKLSIACF